MATPRSNAPLSPGSMRFVELYSGRLSAPRTVKAPILDDESDGPSNVGPLRCARAVMMALCLEATAALFLYGIWHL